MRMQAPSRTTLLARTKTYGLHYVSEWFVAVLADAVRSAAGVLLTKWFYEQDCDESGWKPVVATARVARSPLRSGAPSATLEVPSNREVMMAKGDIHVTPDHKGKGWKVTREGQARAVARAATQAEAEKKGRPVAKRDRVEFNLHARDGRVRAKDSYGKDPRNIAG